jgi:alkylhydroperoxidase/carboxymuconolactone decarboxylase family protein YurZ
LAKSGYQIFQEESPEIAAAFNKLIEAISKPSVLDGKTKNLLYIAMKTVTGDVGARRLMFRSPRTWAHRARKSAKPFP